MGGPDPRAPAASPPDRDEGLADVAVSVFLVLLLATTVLAWPLRDSGAGWVVAVLRVLTVVAGVWALAHHRAWAIVAALAALAVVSVQLASRDGAPVVLASRLVFFSAVGAALLVHVFSRGRITVHRLLGAVAVYVLLAVDWGIAYQLILTSSPDAIRGGSGPASLDDAMWLSFITLTTTGYGDVVPASALARSLAALEAIVGVFYPAILVAWLVSLLRPRAAPP